MKLRLARDGGYRVAMVIQRFRPMFSGQGEQLELLCQVLARRGLELTIVTPGHGPTVTEEIDRYRVVRLRPDMPLGVRVGGPRARARVRHPHPWLSLHSSGL